MKTWLAFFGVLLVMELAYQLRLSARAELAAKRWQRRRLHELEEAERKRASMLRAAAEVRAQIAAVPRVPAYERIRTRAERTAAFLEQSASSWLVVRLWARLRRCRR